MALLAAATLIPGYNRLAWARYERDMLRAATADERCAAETMRRLVDAVETDPTLNRRLAMCELGLMPGGQVVLVDPDAPPSPPPGSIVPARHARPRQPCSLLTHLAARLEHPPTRRGVLLLAVLAILSAALLFPGRSPQDAPDAPAGA